MKQGLNTILFSLIRFIFFGMFLFVFNVNSLNSATSYQLQSVFDSGGGSTAIEGVNVVYQSVSPVFSSVTVKNDIQLVNGNHFTSVATNVDGFLQDFERENVTINATVQGLTNLMVEFEAWSESYIYQFSNPIDDDFLDNGWEIVWDSLEKFT